MSRVERKKVMIKHFYDIFHRKENPDGRDINLREENALNSIELSKLLEVNNVMQLANKQVGVGPCIVKQINVFFGNRPLQGM